jgi:hypothetical protein
MGELGYPNSMRRPATPLVFTLLSASILCGSVISAPPPARAAEDESRAASKSGYHLFRATPNDLLRDLSTDRPDLTESPYTVDAGHVQLEMDLVAYARDDEGDTRAQSWGVAPINLKLGLTPSADLQIIVETHRHDRATDFKTDIRVDASGFGDVTVRLKRNLWGNDAGATAFALMPFVKIPTADDDIGNGAVEGGLILPLAIGLPSGFGFGVMGEVDWLEDSDGEGHHAEWVGTATVGRDVAGPFGAFVEIAAAARPEREGDTIATFDVGVTAALSANAQLDGGVLLGITDEADDRAFFLGLSLRR